MPHSPCLSFDPAQRRELLDIARRSIRNGLDSGRPSRLDLDTLDESLQAPAAVFITLTLDGDLRGCIGSMQAFEPLAQAVANSAFNAAFRDHRFGRLKAAEFDRIRIDISVLSEMQPMEVDSRQDLLEQLRPQLDGLLMQDGGYRSTFLPKVWEKIDSAESFVEQLMLKAGLPAGHWSDTIRFQRYQTESFAEN